MMGLEGVVAFCLGRLGSGVEKCEGVITRGLNECTYTIVCFFLWGGPYHNFSII